MKPIPFVLPGRRTGLGLDGSPRRARVRAAAMAAGMVLFGWGGLDIPTYLVRGETDLRRAFEYRPVVLRRDLPATADGIDFEPEKDPPIDARKHEKRWKENPVYRRSGEVATVTRIYVHEKWIEIHIDGGGYVDQSPVLPSGTGAAAVADIWEDIERHQRGRSGSRVYVRFGKRVPKSAVTPDGLRELVKGVLELAPASPVPPGPPVPQGSTPEQVIASLGDPDERRTGREGGLERETWIYSGSDPLELDFVEGVLVTVVGWADGTHRSPADVATGHEDSLKAFFEGKHVLLKIPMPATMHGVTIRAGEWPTLVERTHMRYSGTPGTSGFRSGLEGVAFGPGELAWLEKIELDGSWVRLTLGGRHVESGEMRAARECREAAFEDGSEEIQDRGSDAQAFYGSLFKGSRFHVSFKGRTQPPTTVAVLRALTPFAVFPPHLFDPAGRRRPPPEPLLEGPVPLHRGTLRGEVGHWLGAPRQQEQTHEGALRVETWTYATDQGSHRLDFIHGVLVRVAHAP